MRYLREPARPAIPGEGLLGWPPVVVLAVVVLVAALDSTGASSWIAYLAAGALGAWGLTIAIREHNDTWARSGVREVELGWDALRTELARSRRHDRTFAVIGVPDEVWVPGGAQPAERAQAGLNAAAAVQELVRRPDRVWADGAMLFILLTDCGKAQATAFVERARVGMPHLFGERAQLVVFPDDGITLGALLGKMRSATGEASTGAPQE